MHYVDIVTLSGHVPTINTRIPSMGVMSGACNALPRLILIDLTVRRAISYPSQSFDFGCFPTHLCLYRPSQHAIRLLRMVGG